MADIILNETEGVTAFGARRFFVVWTPNGSSAPNANAVVTNFPPGYGVTTLAAPTAAGVIKVTLAETGFVRIVGFNQGVQAAAGGNGQGWNLEIDQATVDLPNGIIGLATCQPNGVRANCTADANTLFFAEIILSKNPLDA